MHKTMIKMIFLKLRCIFDNGRIQKSSKTIYFARMCVKEKVIKCKTKKYER